MLDEVKETVLLDEFVFSAKVSFPFNETFIPFSMVKVKFGLGISIVPPIIEFNCEITTLDVSEINWLPKYPFA